WCVAWAGAIEERTIGDGCMHTGCLVIITVVDMLLVKRPGRMRRDGPDGTTSPTLSGVPEVFAQGGGLLDLALDPDFETTGLVYLSFAEPGDGGASTAVARGRLGEAGLGDVEVKIGRASWRGGVEVGGGGEAWTEKGGDEVW